MSKPKGERYRIAVDFDGVIHSYTTPWITPETIPDPPVEGAIAWLNEISASFDVVIFTTRGRSEAGANAVADYLREHGFNQPFTVTHEKPAALVYLDDRAMRFNGPGTFPSAQDVHNARPWNIAQRPHSRQNAAIPAPAEEGRSQ